MNIINWFDTSNLDHLKAYRYLCEKGFWPENFLPEDIEIKSGIQQFGSQGNRRKTDEQDYENRFKEIKSMISRSSNGELELEIVLKED